jgi:hypothetical protein
MASARMMKWLSTLVKKASNSGELWAGPHNCNKKGIIAL